MDPIKIKQLLGSSVIEDMDAMPEQELTGVIVQAEQAMKEVKEELDQNDKYQAAKQACKDLSAGKREVDKYQKGKIQYALSRLTEIGSMDISDRIKWEADSRAKKLEKAAKQAAKQKDEEADEE